MHKDPGGTPDQTGGGVEGSQQGGTNSFHVVRIWPVKEHDRATNVSQTAAERVGGPEYDDPQRHTEELGMEGDGS